MLKRSVTVRRRSAVLLAALGCSVVFTGLSAAPAAARHRHHLNLTQHVALHPRQHVRPGNYTPNFAAIVVDANTGQTLFARNENELRHPASITKVMTLYLLFEQLEKGHLHLDSEIRISSHAASQAPTKLGLPAGHTISVEDAIKAIVTRSANDMAVAVAEAVGGDEDTFADLMTRKAHALGMSRTLYRNASGLPNDEQVTTAHDLALLGRAIQERFPRYYRYFSTHVFYYAGKPIPNHNHLMERIEGMDGIKTGYTRASGFNLLSSVKRNGRYMVSVVMGGASAGSRDRIMADLINKYMDDCETSRTAPQMAEAPIEPALRRESVVAKAEPEARPEPRPVGRPLSLVPENVAPVQVASLNAEVPPERPRPAFVASAPRVVLASDERPATTESINPRRQSLDGSTGRSLGVAPSPTATPSTLRWVAGPAPAKERAPEPIKVARVEPPKPEPVKPAEVARPAVAHTGWMIQIGATDDMAKANELLSRAKSQGKSALNTAQPFTEKVQRGSEILYRARFAGLEEGTAEAACKTLKRSGFACFATKN